MISSHSRMDCLNAQIARNNSMIFAMNDAMNNRRVLLVDPLNVGNAKRPNLWPPALFGDLWRVQTLSQNLSISHIIFWRSFCSDTLAASEHIFYCERSKKARSNEAVSLNYSYTILLLVMICWHSARSHIAWKSDRVLINIETEWTQ